MAYTTIDNPAEFFSATLYSGDSNTSRSITGVGFKPDFLWIKRRNAAERHLLTNAQMTFDNGAYKWLDSSDNSAAFSGGTGVASFDADGFTFKGSDATWNSSSNTYVAWSWKANGGTTASNTDGTITSTVEANTAAGFSIYTYTGTGAAGTVGHGLGGLPDMIILKGRNTTSDWPVYMDPQKDGSLQFPKLNGNEGNIGNSPFTWDTTKFTFTSASSYSNTSGTNYVAYAFRNIQGYSRFGQYVGNSNVNGPFIWTGFKPAFVIIKRTGGTSDYSGWALFDNKRLGYNPTGGPQSLYANRNFGEGKRGQGSANTQEVRIDMLSNGFKVKDGGSDEINDTGDTYIYMAFAENPFVTSTGIPTTAR